MTLLIKPARRIVGLAAIAALPISLSACASVPAAKSAETFLRFDMLPDDWKRFENEQLDAAVSDIELIIKESGHRKVVLLPCRGSAMFVGYEPGVSSDRSFHQRELAAAHVRLDRARANWQSRVLNALKDYEVKTPTIAEIVPMAGNVDVAKLEEWDDQTALRIAATLDVDAVAWTKVDAHFRLFREGDRITETSELTYADVVLQTSTANLIHAASANDRAFRKRRPADDYATLFP